MPRLRSQVYDMDGRAKLDLLMALRMGPTEGDGLTDEDLRIGWEVYGEQIMQEGGHGVGKRVWGWWAFEAREPMPRERYIPSEGGHLGRTEGFGDETVRLAELGELSREELAALQEDANEARLRVGTDAEHISGGWRNTPGAVSMDAQAVELWERVEAVLEARR